MDAVPVSFGSMAHLRLCCGTAVDHKLQSRARSRELAKLADEILREPKPKEEPKEIHLDEKDEKEAWPGGLLRMWLMYADVVFAQNNHGFLQNLTDFPNKTRFHGLGQHHPWREVELLDEEKAEDEKEEPAKGGAQGAKEFHLAWNQWASTNGFAHKILNLGYVLTVFHYLASFGWVICVRRM